MLRIYFGDFKHYGENPDDTPFDMPYVYNPKLYFDYNYDKEWFNDPFVRNIVEDVDKSYVIYDGVIDSPFLGIITPPELSGGTRALTLMYKTDGVIYNATFCGDNCSKWLLEIGKMKDLTVNLSYLMDFDYDEDFEIYIVNDGSIVRTREEYLDAAFTYLHR